ncbi:MAG TPA: PIN domain-containing protein [Kiritimatiellia bacterium]|nr:PIN domain-containing protein [Kiritimatiellia bacterium]
MILIDTSLWVHQMRRKGDPAKRQRVENLLLSGEAAWCPMIRLELWAGVGNDRERAILKEYEQVIPEFSIDDEVWQEACELAERCRRAGKTAPATDLLIAACARRHKVALEHADRHFDLLGKL